MWLQGLRRTAGRIRTADLIIPNDVIREAFCEKMVPYYLWPGNFDAVAQIAAYTEGEEWLEALLAYLKENAEYR